MIHAENKAICFSQEYIKFALKRGIIALDHDGIEGISKRCGSCGEYWPADSEFFRASSYTTSGLRSQCRACEDEKINETRILRSIGYSIMRGGKTLEKDGVSIKKCSKCFEFFPATPEFFCRDKSQSDGLLPRCKTCRNAARMVKKWK